MQTSVWEKAIEASADRHRAQHYLEQLRTAGAAQLLKKPSAEQARILVALLSGSQALSESLVAHPDWLQALMELEGLEHPRQAQGLERELQTALKPVLRTSEYTAAFTKLRQFKQREMLRIGARDLARLGNMTEITRELSDVADVCLNSAWKLCRQQFTGRFGQPYHQDAEGRWQPTEFCVVGLGKLGGKELNYSSDVDLIFLYSEEGEVFKAPPVKGESGARGLTNHQFFNRLIKTFIEEVTRLTPDGTLYRIDLRLRPEGDTGPLVRSLASYENYYAQWGQTWERMMLLKARRVAGDEALAGEFFEMIQPFCYPRSLVEGVLREVAAMKDRIESEVVKAGELERNVKLGRGGIREIEFVAQTLQLLHAGRLPFLQGAQTLGTLEKLVKYKLLAAGEARSLTEAYCFLRDVEHRLQMENNLQTHTIPTGHEAQERLAALMGFAALNEFDAARRAHTRNVRTVYDKLLKAEAPEIPVVLPRQFEGAEVEWKKLLAEHSFKDAEKSFRLLREFAEGPGYVHVSRRTVELAQKLIPKLLGLCPHDDNDAKTSNFEHRTSNIERKRARGRATPPLENPRSASANRQSPILSDPDRVLTRLDSFISAYGARATLIETWNSNPSLFELLLWLFDRSEFLAETAIRTPDLVDELVLSGRLRRGKTTEETLKELRHGLADPDQRLWLRRYHQAEFMRIGLRDILGLTDTEQVFVELSALADACLQYALEAVMRKRKWQTAPLAIIGLGKLGGAELNYGSDLDIVFVADDKTKNLPKLQGVAAEVMEMLSSPTEIGVAFVTDARLRPDGEKGLLVNTLRAYEDYYRHRTQLWEIQSISRTRPVAGDLKLGDQFQKLAATLTNFKKHSLIPAEITRLKTFRPKTAQKNNEPRYLGCYTPNWKQKIHQMRMRIERERTPAGKDELAIKTGKGGSMDAEFIAQTLCLEHGWQEANTLRALERGRETKVLPAADKLIENYGQLRRLERILRRWSFEGETVLPDDPAPYYRVSIRCGFATPEAFRAALAEWRAAIRDVYLKVFT